MVVIYLARLTGLDVRPSRIRRGNQGYAKCNTSNRSGTHCVGIHARATGHRCSRADCETAARVGAGVDRLRIRLAEPRRGCTGALVRGGRLRAPKRRTSRQATRTDSEILHGGGPLALRAIAFAAEGSIGYIIGGFARKEGEADIGKFTLTLRKGGDGRWLIMSDMDSANQRGQ